MSGSIKGRGAAVQPANPYLPVRLESDFEHVADDDEYLAQLGRPPTEYFPDESQSIVTENDSPDVGFRYSVNPYRGCSHGCSYCYARPYARVPRPQRRPRFRNQGVREVSRRRAAARFPGPAQPGSRRRSFSPASPIATSRPSASSASRAAAWRSPPSAGSRSASSPRTRSSRATSICCKQLAAHNAVRVSLSITTLDAAARPRDGTAHQLARRPAARHPRAARRRHPDERHGRPRSSPASTTARCPPSSPPPAKPAPNGPATCC